MSVGRTPVAVVMSSVMMLGSTAGCATIINGRSQDVALASAPPGAAVKIDSVQTTTPGKVTLRRNQDYNAVFTKEGFPERPVKLESKASWWLLGNVIFGGLIGLIIDLAAGGGFKLVPGSVDMDLASGTVKEVEKKDETKTEEKK